MADQKISALTGATTPLAGTEVLPIVQGSTTVKVAVSNLTAGRAVSMLSAALTNDLTVGGATASSFEGNVRAVVGSGSGVPVLTLYGGNNTYGGLYFSDGTTGNEKYRGFLEYNHATDSLAIGTSGGTKFTFSSDGNFAPSTAAKGVNFTANTPAAGMTSQLLNWYEEGTFTPTFSGFTIGDGSVFGYYTRVGKAVTLVFGFKFGATSSISTLTGFSGLPFASRATVSNSYAPIPGVAFDAGGNWFSVMGNFPQNSTSTEYPLKIDGNSAITSTVPMTWAVGDVLTFNCTYICA